jgi:uncharacterized membrane protein
MRIHESIVVSVPAVRAWRFLRNPDHYREFMSGLTRWDVEGEIREGLGARYRMLLRVGSAELGGLIEIVEEVPERELAWTSITGIDQRGRWRLRSHGETTTLVELRFAYGVAGSGLGGWIAEQVAAPTVRRRMRSSLRELKRRLEAERAEAPTAAGAAGAAD